MYPITGTVSHSQPAWTDLINGSACVEHCKAYTLLFGTGVGLEKQAI